MGASFLKLKKKILGKEAMVCVVGLGYVGLPLALECVKKGFSVLGIDLDKERIASLKKKKSYITDVSGSCLKKALLSGRFRFSDNFCLLKECGIVLLCVPTPLKRRYLPDISFIKSAVKAVAANMKKGSLIILESTTYPGTTQEVILPLIESYGFRHGTDFYLCFSPERIDPGNLSYPPHKIPKVIGGINKEATELGAAFYGKVMDKAVPVSSARSAEAAKLLENTFRLVNIGLINELAMMAHKMDIDIWEVIEAAKSKPFGFMPFYPGPGVGGHCIPKDPIYLYWKAKKFGFKSKFIKLASDITVHMPAYVVQRAADILERDNIALCGSKVLVLGATYKKDVRDLRKSPAIDIIEILQSKGAQVSYSDPLIPYLTFRSLALKSAALSRSALLKFDLAIVATDHSRVDYRRILRHCRRIFDTRNIYRNIRDSKITKL